MVSSQNVRAIYLSSKLEILVYLNYHNFLLILVLITAVHLGNIVTRFNFSAPVCETKPDVPSVSPWLRRSVGVIRIRSDEGLTLETSAFASLYGGQFTLSTQLIKPNYLVTLPPTQHHSFFRNLPHLCETKVHGVCTEKTKIDQTLQGFYNMA